MMTISRGCLLAATLLLPLVVANCAPSTPGLAGSEWRPTEIGGVAVPADSEIFIQFGDEGTLQGHGGCNGFMGSYKLDGDSIEISPLGATMMACPEAIMERERRFFDALQKSEHFERDGTDLTLSDELRATTAKLVQTDPD